MLVPETFNCWPLFAKMNTPWAIMETSGASRCWFEPLFVLMPTVAW